MKIIFFTDRYDLGGVSNVLTSLARAFEEELGAQIVFVELFPSLHSDAMAGFKIKSVYKKKGLFWRVFKRFLHLGLRRFFAEENADLIISAKCPMNIMAIRSRPKCPLIISEHGQRSAIKKKLQRLQNALYPRADALVLLTNSASSDYSLDNKVVIANLLSFPELDFAKEKIVFICSRLAGEKGIDVLIEALKSVDLRGFRVLVAGPGEFLEELKTMSKGLDVEFLGALGQREVYEHYSRARIFFFHSYTEGLPTTLIEAAHFGCARVVSGGVPGVLELVEHEKNALVYEMGQAKAAALALQRLIDDEYLEKELRHNAKGLCASFSRQSILPKWLELFKRLGVLA